MNKTQLFIGPKGSGKSIKAREIMAKHSDPVVLSLRSDRDLLYPFVFEECTADTSLIVFEDIDYQRLSWFWLDEMARSGITVERRGKPKFKIWPKFIFISQNRPKSIDYKSSLNHYDVIAF